jgi:hypothetical protein
MRTPFKQILLKSIHAFFKNNLKKSQKILNQLVFENLTSDELWELNKFHQIFFLGQLLGIHSLHCILRMHGITSNSLQKKYSDLCKRLTHNKLKIIYEEVFEYNFTETVESLAQKSSSEWSKSNVTVLQDASVFKQLLQNTQIEKDSEYYGRWYSGQYHSVVSGFKVQTLGVTIQNIFYPLFLEYVKKKDPNESEIALSVQLLSKWDRLWQKIRKKCPELPLKLHFSCDNGYSHKDLVAACEKKN